MYLIFDIGGSSTKLAIIDRDDKIIEKARMKKESSMKDFLIALEREIDKYRNKYNIEGISFSSPGRVDPITARVEGLTALEYLSEFNFVKYFREKYKLPIAIENDAICACLCELYFSKPKEKNIAFLVIGSGIGGALVNDGKVIHGRRNEGGEFGYMLLDMRTNDNFSKLATLPNVRDRIYRKYGIRTDTFEILDKYFKRINPYYKETKRMFKYLIRGLYNIQYIYDPELIYIGGAISASSQYINEIKRLSNKSIYKEANMLIRPVTFFNDNNLLGAYVNLLEYIKEGI